MVQIDDEQDDLHTCDFCGRAEVDYALDGDGRSWHTDKASGLVWCPECWEEEEP